MKLASSTLVLLDASFRHLVDPLSRPPLPNYPQTEVPMEIGLQKGSVPNTYAVTLRVSIQSPNDLYIVSVAYVVLLTLELEGAEPPPPDLDTRIMATGAFMALPFCRELVANMTSRGRFGTVWINPTNFNDLGKQQQATEATVATE